MTQQTATLEIGLTRTTDSTSLFEDTIDADVEASMERFDEILLERVQERFPEATVELVARGYIWDNTVDPQTGNGNDTPLANEAQLAIQWLADELHQSDAWIVEAE